MRIAPVGLVANVCDTREQLFDLAVDIARLTHGHPSGYLAAGYLALLIAGILDGREITSSSASAIAILREHEGHTEVLDAIKAALTLAENGPFDVAKLDQLGQGWVAEEAVAIALYCVLTAASFADGVLHAVNHGGDSDSTGAIAGNILGALYGIAAVPRKGPRHWSCAARSPPWPTTSTPSGCNASMPTRPGSAIPAGKALAGIRTGNGSLQKAPPDEPADPHTNRASLRVPGLSSLPNAGAGAT